jgi:hypothetical protein
MSDLIERLRTYPDRMLTDPDGLMEEAASRIEELEAQVEALQNKCARRGLSPEDSDALEAENERLRAVYEAANSLYSGGLWPDNHDYILISDRSLQALDEALYPLEKVNE